MSWEAEAVNWIAWARTPGHDVYWHYRDAFFALVPPPGRATLEIGCGEGRVDAPREPAGEPGELPMFLCSARLNHT